MLHQNFSCCITLEPWRLHWKITVLYSSVYWVIYSGFEGKGIKSWRNTPASLVVLIYFLSLPSSLYIKSKQGCCGNFQDDSIWYIHTESLKRWCSHSMLTRCLCQLLSLSTFTNWHRNGTARRGIYPSFNGNTNKCVHFFLTPTGDLSDVKVAYWRLGFTQALGQSWITQSLMFKGWEPQSKTLLRFSLHHLESDILAAVECRSTWNFLFFFL